MNVYQAIIATAQLFEQRPERYEFRSIEIPAPGPACGSTGCAIGWIAYFLGYPPDPNTTRNFDNTAELITGEEYEADEVFYRQLDQVRCYPSANWRNEASACAETLREYAKEHCDPRAPDVVVAKSEDPT